MSEEPTNRSWFRRKVRLGLEPEQLAVLAVLAVVVAAVALFFHGH